MKPYPLAALLLLAACNGGSPTADPAEAPADPYVPEATAEPAAAAPAAPSRLPQDLVVATNEPFWNAAVEGDRVVLTGADSPRRELRIVSDDTVSATRRIVARDARGRVTVEVIDRPCVNDMSGLPFPHSGTISIGAQGPFRGCAAPPQGTPATNMIPGAFVGLWAADAAGCRLPPESIEWVRIDPQSMRFHESLAVPQAVRARGRTVQVELAFEGEGQRWRATKTLSLSDDGDMLEITDPGLPTVRRMRCSRLDAVPEVADAETSPAAARDVVLSYYSAIDRRDYDAAYRLWSDAGGASGKSAEAFARELAAAPPMRVAVDAPGRIEGAAGSLYVEVPVRLDARRPDGSTQHYEGSYVLRRSNDVPGAGPEQRRWRIAEARLRATTK
jgi:uncharacterized membrane protein